MTFPKIRYAFVSWLDAHSPRATDVFDPTSISEVHGTMPMVTAGWVLRQDTSGISIASEWLGVRFVDPGVTHAKPNCT